MTELAIHGGPEAAAELTVPEWPQCTEQSKENVLDALESNAWCSINGEAEWVTRFENRFAEYHDADHAIACANGTVALELALKACGLEPGDEVIVPSYTFIATASAVATLGGVPRFADVDPDTFNLTAEAIEDEITEDTVGVIGVHFAGYPMDMDAIGDVVDAHDLFFVEDSAHAQGSEWRGQKVGTLGDAGAFSFQESKALPGGEGGIVVTDDELLAEEARLLGNIGRSPDAAGYKHYELASNYRMTEFQGALLCAQLEKLPEENARRQENEALLVEELADVDGIVTKPRDDRITNRGYCLFNVRYDAEAFGGLPRDRFLEALRAEGVPASDGYQMPLYRQPGFSREGMRSHVPSDVEVPMYRHLDRPGAELVTETNVSIAHTVLLADGIETIPAAVRKIRDNVDALR